MTFAAALGEGSVPWHLAHSTLAWAPANLYLAVEWSNRVTSFHLAAVLATVWQRSHFSPTCPLCLSSWQVPHAGPKPREVRRRAFMRIALRAAGAIRRGVWQVAHLRPV